MSNQASTARRTLALAAIATMICASMLAMDVRVVSASEDAGEPNWSVFIYMNSDNNLDPFAPAEVEEMMNVGSSAEVNILLLWDRLAGPAYLYKVIPNDLELDAGWPLQEEELNMGDPEILGSYVSYAFENYPASHVMLEFFCHGSIGEGISTDVTTGTSEEVDYLTHQEMLQALDGYVFDVVAFDECWIGLFEILSEYSNGGLQADYVVASEWLLGAEGFPYTAIFERLVAEPSMSGEDLSAVIAQEFAAQYPAPIKPSYGWKWQVLSAMRLSDISNLYSDFDKLCELLLRTMDSNHNVLESARDDSLIGWWGLQWLFPVVDLDNLVATICNRCKDPEIVDACKLVLSDIDNAILASGKTRAVGDSANGISVLFPQTEEAMHNVIDGWGAQYWGPYRDMGFADIWMPVLNAYYEAA